MDLYNEILELFEERKFLRTRETVPTYACSIGSHIFNIYNKSEKILTDGGLIPDMRSHIFMVTIPGFGKSYLINQMLHDRGGILGGTDLKIGKIADMNSAALVGSIKTTPDGAKARSIGKLERDKEAILGCEEFANITSGKKQSYNANLINVLLTALDSGDMNKDQSAGGIKFETFTTMWGATQPGRFDLESGLNRRFLFVIYMPTYQDSQKLIEIRETNKNLDLNADRLLNFKMNLNKKIKDITNIKSVEFSKEYYQWMKQFHIMHYEAMLYERLLLGYWIMKLDVLPEKLVLTLDDEIKRILELQVDTRLHAQMGVDKIKITDVIGNLDRIKQDKLIKILLGFALDYETEIKSQLAGLVQRGILREDGKDFVIVEKKGG